MIILFLQNGDGVGEHKISNERSQCIVCFIKFLKIFQDFFFAYEQIHSRTPKWIAKKTKLSLRSNLTHIYTHHQHYRKCETVSLAPPCDPG